MILVVILLRSTGNDVRERIFMERSFASLLSFQETSNDKWLVSAFFCLTFSKTVHAAIMIILEVFLRPGDDKFRKFFFM